MQRIIFRVLLILMLTSPQILLAKVSTKENVVYITRDKDQEDNVMDIYAPDHAKSAEVMLFIHGGRWTNGDKKIYNFIGKNLAKKGKIGIVINYRKTPKVMYEEMAMDCASAIKWVKDHISEYGGNPEKIFISGHSAGAHLAAYIIFNKVYERMFENPNPVRGCVLIDAFGIDLYSYLIKYKTEEDKLFYKTFTNNPDEWKKASPIYSTSKTDVNFYIFAGSKTYPPILESSKDLTERLKDVGNPVRYEIIKGKKHAGMIIQMYWPWNKMYSRIIDFMETTAPAGRPGEFSAGK